MLIEKVVIMRPLGIKGDNLLVVERIGTSINFPIAYGDINGLPIFVNVSVPWARVSLGIYLPTEEEIFEMLNQETINQRKPKG